MNGRIYINISNSHISMDLFSLEKKKTNKLVPKKEQIF